MAFQDLSRNILVKENMDWMLFEIKDSIEMPLDLMGKKSESLLVGLTPKVVGHKNINKVADDSKIEIPSLKVNIRSWRRKLTANWNNPIEQAEKLTKQGQEIHWSAAKARNRMKPRREKPWCTKLAS